MGVVTILKPLTYEATGSMAGPARVATPDPKEAAVAPGAGAQFIDLDLGAPTAWDTVFVGFTQLAAGSALSLQAGNSSSTDVDVLNVLPAPSDGEGPQHYLFRPGAQAYRYLRISQQGMVAGGIIGIIAVGLGWQPLRGHEWGSGRPIEDTSNVERLFGGGFGIDEGAIIGGWSWTYGDLSDADLSWLWGFSRKAGSSRTALVVENPDFTDGLNERLHWGLFKFDTYERLSRDRTKWAISVRDWG